ncbi:early nodulin-like protein 20 [Humulus lupulus]|uniref:early nodulin-like protein 20 n=1 Tax=Humulus lupulus TaxID=3486 RepID=UPI002B416CC4|nr:early nodulin-like protein 20 [Humulus lupulus]
MAGVVAVVAAWLAITATAKPVLHKVGGSQGWNQNVNYTEWSSSTGPFLLGDWLYFGFDKRYYNVLEVNKTSYESCNDRVFIKNVTRGGRDVFELTEAKPYYFISGGGYCFHGMRVTISVSKDDGGRSALPPAIAASTSAPVLAPAPAAEAPSKNGSPSLLRLDLFLYLIVLCVTTYYLYYLFSVLE